MGDVFSLFGSLAILALILASSVWAPVKLWAASEEFLVSACTSAWLISPWEATDERCSAVIGFKLGAVGLIVMAWASWKMAVRFDSTKSTREQQK